MLQCLNEDCAWNKEMKCTRGKQYLDHEGRCTSKITNDKMEMYYGKWNEIHNPIK